MTPTSGSKQQRARFQPVQLRTIFLSFISHLSPPTHPSTTSESALGSSYYSHAQESTSGSASYTAGAPGSLPLEVLHAWDRDGKRRKKSRKGSQANSNSRFGGDDDDCIGPQEPVSHVVVDNDFDQFTPKPAKSGSDSGSTPIPAVDGGDQSRGTQHAAESQGSGIFGRRRKSPEKGKNKSTSSKGKEKSKGKQSEKGKNTEERMKMKNQNETEEEDDAGYGVSAPGSDASDAENARHGSRAEKRTGSASGYRESNSARRDLRKSWFKTTAFYELVVERLWLNIKHFMDSSYPEEAKERSYQKEAWFSSKMAALASAFFFIVNYVLTLALLSRPYSSWNWYMYFGTAGFFTLPLPVFVMWDFPRTKNWIWQPWLLGGTWIFPIILVIEMHLCGYFAVNDQCGTRNYMNLLGYAMGMPTLAVIVMRQSRALHGLGAIVWIILISVLDLNEPEVPALFYRNVIDFALYHVFLIGTSFFRERSDRQMFALRQQLKIQYRAVQSAQVMERKASDSKKRFVSYIFHEVRVPLNTALLAVQNLVGEKVFEGIHQDQKEMVDGLMGSLTMMEKVLNDVLSFNRMESGKFTQARKTFSFHRSIQLVALSHRSQADMAGVDLFVELDPDVEKIGGEFIGDEMRLRQVTSNLVSNALKFTDTGSVRIVTKLLFPRLDPTPSTEIDDPLRQAEINAERQKAIESAEATHRSLAQSDIEKGSVHIENVRHSRESNRSQNPALAPSTPAPGSTGADTTHSSSIPSSTSTAVNPAPRSGSTGGLGASFSPGPGAEAGFGGLSGASSTRQGVDGDGNVRRKAVIRVEIHDTGVGMKKQDIIDNRLFSPYVQTEIGRRQGGKGSGLGLALVRQIVKLSGGRLGVDSEFGKGSTFWFELPYSLPPSPKSIDKPDLALSPTLPPPSVSRAFSVDQGIEGGGMSLAAADEVFGPRGSLSMVGFGPGVSLAGGLGVSSVGVGGGGRKRPSTAPTNPESKVLGSSSPSTAGSSGVGEIGGEEAGLRSIVSKTESTRLLLGHPSTTTIMSTFSPPKGSSDEEPRWIDPFVTPSTERRSSEWTAFGGSVVSESASGSGGGTAVTGEGEMKTTVGVGESDLEKEKGKEKVERGEKEEIEGGEKSEEKEADDTTPLSALVVDDDPLTRMLMSRMLKRLGHRVITAENGKIALDLIRDNHLKVPDAPVFDVCFLDNQMPILNGVEVVREVREMGCPLYIVGCTGNALREDQDEYLAAGADEIIPKPIHQRFVVEVIKNARKRIKGETAPTWESSL